MTATSSLERRCDLLRSLHRPGAPLVLPNAWDVATAKAVVAAGFPVVATTSGGVAATLGYADHEQAPASEMLAAAARRGGCAIRHARRTGCTRFARRRPPPAMAW